MKEIEFSEEQFSDLESVKNMLFSDEKDPRSTAYVRVLHRPRIPWFRVALAVFLPLLAATFLGLLLHRLGTGVLFYVLVPLLLLLVYTVCMARAACLCFIRIYQRYAPAAVRNKCRFEPSCSEYAIRAIEKYGLIRGIKTSIGRFRRCNINGGGFDEP